MEKNSSKALVVLNIGNNFFHIKSRQSYLHACERWGCDFIEITEDPSKLGIHPWWQKMFVIDRMKDMGYNHVLQLDTDMLIRIDCPSLFDMVSPPVLGITNSRSPLKPLRYWANVLDLPFHKEMKKLNAGLFLYSPNYHQSLFEKIRDYAKNRNWDHSHQPEQSALSVYLHHHGSDIPYVWLPHTFNFCRIREGKIKAKMKISKPFMGEYIYHFNGVKLKYKREVRDYRWDILPRIRLDFTMDV